MRRIALLLASMMLALVLVSGAAWAAYISCSTGADGLCEGTEAADELEGTPDVDTMNAKGGSDYL